MEAHGTGSWVVDRVSVDRVGSKSGSALTGLGQYPSRALTGSSQSPGLPLTGSGQNPGRALTGSCQNPGRQLTGSSQKFGSGSDRVRDDVSMTSASDNLNRLTGLKTDRGRTGLTGSVM